MGDGPSGLGLNPTTNRIYSANFNSDTLTVIEGATNGVVRTVAVGDGPTNAVANPSTNRVYVANGLADSVTVIQE